VAFVNPFERALAFSRDVVELNPADLSQVAYGGDYVRGDVEARHTVLFFPGAVVEHVTELVYRPDAVKSGRRVLGPVLGASGMNSCDNAALNHETTFWTKWLAFAAKKALSDEYDWAVDEPTIVCKRQVCVYIASDQGAWLVGPCSLELKVWRHDFDITRVIHRNVYWAGQSNDAFHEFLKEAGVAFPVKYCVRTSRHH